MLRIRCACGCPEYISGGRRFYFSEICGDRVNKRAQRARTKHVENAAKRKKRMAVLGRRCIGCRKTDKQTNWSDGKLCKACKSLQDRHGSCPCGRPLWRRGIKGAALICRGNCGQS